EMADRLEVGRDGPDCVLGYVRKRNGLLNSGQLFGVLDGVALRSFEVGKVAQRGLAKWHQQDLDAGRERARRNREIGPAEVRPGADGGEQVLDQRQVQHLLLGDVNQLSAPAAGKRRLLGAQSFASVAFQGERGEQV